MTLTSADWVQIVGWPITFILGIVATLATQWMSKKRKTVGWSIISESNLLSDAALQQVRDGFGVPIEIRVRSREVTDLSTIRIKVGNVGSVELKDITLHFLFGEQAEVYVGRYAKELGVYSHALTLDKQGNRATLSMQHINRGQSFEIEFLVGNYHAGDCRLDMAEPGINLKRVTTLRLEKELGVLEFVALGIGGVRIDRTAMQTAILADELRNLRKVISEHLRETKLAQPGDTSNTHSPSAQGVGGR